MSTTKYYDSTLGKWVVSGTSNATGLEVTNSKYVSDSNSTDLDSVLSTISDNIVELKQNLAWIYKNGATGSGGSGSSSTTYTITVAEGSTVYTSDGTATLNVTINSGTSKKLFTVLFVNKDTGTTIKSTNVYSLVKNQISLTGLSDTTNIEIQAYDSLSNYATAAYVTIISGSINLTIQSTPARTIINGATAPVNAVYTVTNNISGATSEFIFKGKIITATDYTTIDDITNITTSTRTLTYNLRDIIFNTSFSSVAVNGAKFEFTAIARTVLNGTTISSNSITYNITISDSDTLIIVTDSISEIAGTYTEFSKGSQLSFQYYLSYAPTKYQIFNMDYTLSKVSDPNTAILTGNIPNITKGTNSVFSISTVNLSEDTYQLKLYGYSASDSSDTTAQYTKIVYCKITAATKVDLYANNDDETLLAYFSRITGFPNNTTGTWNYKPTTTFPYTGTFSSKFPNGVNLISVNTNGSTTGYISDTDSNKTPGIVLKGQSYAYLDVAKQMFPKYEISEGNSFFQPQGFNISLTYKIEETVDSDQVVMSLGTYKDDALYSGIEITSDQCTLLVGSAISLQCDLPQNEIVSVDFNITYEGSNYWYFFIYVNGTMTRVGRVLQSDIDWMFEQNIYFGCRYNSGTISNYSDITIYDIKLYTSAQNYANITQNYISAYEQANLNDGAINSTLDTTLRLKNFFNDSGKCIIWNYDQGVFYDGDELYTLLVQQMEVNTPYSICKVEETSATTTEFKQYTSAIYSADKKDEIMSKTFPCKFTFINTLGTCLVSTPSGVSSDNGVSIGLQGTSSLSYMSKNFELYCGDSDTSGTKQLFQPIDDWNPENEFTLKADVMDSAHVNNVVIGKIINGEGVDTSGNSVSLFESTPPMKVPDSVFNSSSDAAKIKERMRFTSDGFPCLLFITYAPNSSGVKETKFMGIYNFNLGRYAYYNLGLKLLTSYTKQYSSGPTLISSYTENDTYWNTDTSSGVYSFEINQNNSAQGAFQQDDLSIIEFMADAIYYSQDKNIAYSHLQKFYTQMANMALSSTQKYTMDDAGQTPTKLLSGTYEYNSAYYQFSECDKHLNWNNACYYFIIALVFGMVDSMCKNLTLRSWGSLVEYPSFYDMDTAMKKENDGKEDVSPYAHLHRWYNYNDSDTGITTYTVQKNYSSSGSLIQYYASWWNRIWEVLENLPIKDSGSVSSDRTTLESAYTNMRNNLFPNTDDFIDKYYKAYTDKTGAIMFNYDFSIKYLTVQKTYNTSTGEYDDSTDFSQLSFLHGNSTVAVKKWFKERIYFLDGVYGVNTLTQSSSLDSPITNIWVNNKASGLSNATNFSVTMQGSSFLLYRWSFDKTNGAFWINDSDTAAVVPPPGGQAIVYVYTNKNITKFDNFKDYPWTSLSSIDLPRLKELDLSGLNIDSTAFFVGGVYNSSSDIGLKNIEKLILSNIKFTNSTTYTLDASGCSKLKYLDVSGSDISTINLPSSTLLETYILDNTSITSLSLSGQSFLSTLSLSGCNSLKTVTLNNCGSLKNLTLPSSVETISITNCSSLSDLEITYTSTNGSISSLKSIIIDTCTGLKTFNIAGQNNPALSISLVGAWNLENLNITDVVTTDITFPSLKISGVSNFSSLKTLQMSRTNFSNFIYNDNSKDSNGNFIANTYLDLSQFTNLQSIVAQSCTKLTKVVCKNINGSPVSLSSYAFMGCTSLQRIVGNYQINGQYVFRNCVNLYLNDSSIYNSFLPTDYITDSNGTNISFNSSSLIGIFQQCTMLSYNDFKRIIIRIPSICTSTESLFDGCSNISGSIWRDMLSSCTNVINTKRMFAGTGLTGILYSRKSSYVSTDTSTYSLLDFIPNCTESDSMFSGSSVTWIDNNFYVGCALASIDSMFASCTSLKSCVDTNATSIVSGNLSSKTFFTNIANLVNLYPANVFSGCTGISMNIDTDDSGNTYLFHTNKSNPSSTVLTNSLYTGVKLIGEIKNNVFGSLTKTIGTYKIPAFTSIQYPFNTGYTTANINISQMSSIFTGLTGILQLIGVFNGLNLIGSKVIPSTIFSGLSSLTSIRNIFNGIGIDNDSEVYEFPNSTLFNDCANLSDISGILANNNNLKLKLLGEGFKNCKLTDVSYAFQNTGLFGTIPYRLFLMVNGNSILNTIDSMIGVFNGCWNIGYTSDRVIDVTTQLSSTTTVQWSNHIVSTAGTRVTYKLDTSNIQKVNTYDGTGVNKFDSWYLDGYGFDGASSTDSDFSTFKTSMSTYIDYDATQKQALVDNETTSFFRESHQNYAIPTDLFRYCSSNCTLSGILNDLFWVENTLTTNSSTGYKSIVTGSKIEGILGRIPMRLLESLTSSTEFDNIFSNTYFDAFVSPSGTSATAITTGLMYPPDLFQYNTSLTKLSGVFSNTLLYDSCMIGNIFSNLTLLTNISKMWSDCTFSNMNYSTDISATFNPIDFANIFINNKKITDASGLFQVSDSSKTTLGLKIIDSTLLNKSLYISNISNMFMYNVNLKGSLPLFDPTVYSAINTYSNYITGVSQSNITNASSLNSRYKPSTWS